MSEGSRYEAPWRLLPYLNNLRFCRELLDDVINQRAGYHPRIARPWMAFGWPRMNRSGRKAWARRQGREGR